MSILMKAPVSLKKLLDTLHDQLTLIQGSKRIRYRSENRIFFSSSSDSFIFSHLGVVNIITAATLSFCPFCIYFTILILVLPEVISSVSSFSFNIFPFFICSHRYLGIGGGGGVFLSKMYTTRCDLSKVSYCHLTFHRHVKREEPDRVGVRVPLLFTLFSVFANNRHLAKSVIVPARW
jgi:hypothetical protein